MIRRGTSRLPAIATGIGLAVAVLSACGVKAPPRPPLREVQPAPAVAPAATGPTGPSGPSGASGSTGSTRSTGGGTR